MGYLGHANSNSVAALLGKGTPDGSKAATRWPVAGS
jgi:hypothetical protein